MSHGTVAVMATDAALDRGAIVTALALTEIQEAHLDIHCLGIESTPPDAYMAGPALMLTMPDTESAVARAEELEHELRSLIPAHRGNVQLHRHHVREGMIGRNVGEIARFADRVVATAPYGPEARPLQVAVLEASLFAGGLPVIVVPDGGAEITPCPGRLMLAWDGSREAMVAARAALPMLLRARLVDVVIVDPEVQVGARSDPGGDIALFLARNGVAVEVSVLARSRFRNSEVLRRHAMDTGAEAVVMGAYGHSRLREQLIGGTTREMLTNARLPLILAR
jgi:nucleotide-binding universal stress UspA family protein